MGEVEHFLIGYPSPSPPDKSPDEIFNPKDYTDVDNRARQAPADLVSDFGKLMTYLLKGVTSDLAKVRSIFIWLSAQEVIKAHFPKAPRPNTPLSWLKRIKIDRSYYTELFTIMCRKADVPCVIIRGSSKGAGYEVGQTQSLQITNRWNAVHVQGSWQLVNVPWALISVDGLGEDTWEKWEEDGTAVREEQVSKREVWQDFDEFYFLTKPEDFNAFCHPQDPRWQLLDSPWTDEEFLDTPRYIEGMFKSDWELLSENKGVLVASKGACEITFAHPDEDVQNASLTYNLLFKREQDDAESEPEFKTERHVLVNSKRGEKSLVTRLPKVGMYRIQVAGLLDDTLTPLNEFCIQCPDVMEKSVQFPEGCSEIGMTERAIAMGVNEASQDDGIVQAQPGEKLIFRFKFSKEKPPPRDVRATIIHNDVPADQLSRYADVQLTKDDVNVSVQVPTNTGIDEYGVCIDAMAAPRDGDNQSEDIAYVNIINYIVTQDKNLDFPEQRAIAKIKAELLRSMKTRDMVRFHNVLNGMGDKLDPISRAKLNAFYKEVNKVKVDKLEALVQAMNGSDIDELEKALAQYEILGDVNQENTQHARVLLALLRALENDTDMGKLDKALQAAYDVRLNRNSNVLRAEDILVAYHEKVLSEAYYKRSLEAVEAALEGVDKSCVAARVRGQYMFIKVEELQRHLKEIKKLTEKIKRLQKKDMDKMAGPRGKEPHPHVRSVLMATFILLGEKEGDLWNWEVVQNLLERRSESGMARAMANLDVDALKVGQVDKAEGCVRACQLEVVSAEDPNVALFLQWVQRIIEEKRGRDSVKHHHTQIHSQP